MWNVADIANPVVVLTISLPDVPFSISIGGGKERKHALLSVSTKDGYARVYDCADYGKQIFEADGHKGSKASRVFWLSDNSFGTVGFSQISEREVRLYDIVSGVVSAALVIDTSPSLFEAYFDVDTNLLFLSGRGDSYTFILEVYLGDKLTSSLLTKIDNTGCQQGVCFLPKTNCEVKQVEIAVGWRITPTAVEQVSFCVPRRRIEFFQDDIFPDTRDTGAFVAEANQWCVDYSVEMDVELVSLCPLLMTSLKDAPVVKAPSLIGVRKNVGYEMTDDERKQKMFGGMDQKKS
jgi:coronin-7